MTDHGNEPVPGDYYGQHREDLVDFILANTGPVNGRALDVGCAKGHVGAALRRGGWEVWGVETNEAVAAVASECLNRVLVGQFPSPVAALEGAPYGLILFADSLEHMDDPWAAIAAARNLLAPDGVIVVSVPNVSHWSVMRELWRGTWNYADFGLLDRTHLRFFTPRTLETALESAGLACAASHMVRKGLRRRYTVVEWMLRRIAPHALVLEMYVAARALDTPVEPSGLPTGSYGRQPAE